MIWNNSKMTSLYYSKHAADEEWPCVVKITDTEIMVEYNDDDLYRYVGKAGDGGHFELHSPELNGRGTLHRFPDSQILEGSWIEGSERGMWRIELGS